ncbi:hypothetical protein ACLKMH_13430 [Psychromonas sp. KJ10-10]|uniref:hypothetical protein n=1 Tax=Psychromonas sp. KJ10-10 TaxID=3391823 RepID=UPI0039B39D73
MSNVFHDLLNKTLSERTDLKQIFFAGDSSTPPLLSYQVNFPRLELVVSGQYNNQIEGSNHDIIDIPLITGDVLFIPRIVGINLPGIVIVPCLVYYLDADK